MGYVDKSKLERVYEKSTEFHGRDEKGVIKDVIYRGIFEKTLIYKHHFEKKELKEAEKNGWLKRVFVNRGLGSGHEAAYYWLGEEMPQRTPIKAFFDRIYRYFRGEYRRYYGR